ncbi:uncharacterized protein LODBEIA_P34510 [Lodderomyces beijingensis]|uniref:Nuclear condensin complex subunit 3 C-terminal domain-containing protein n=1 Tax=Lodderomyces beijingensis TaxID=1775926 RepID=A0ABP0ZSG4_9ASCO
MDRPPKPTLESIPEIDNTRDLGVAMTHVFNDCQFETLAHRKLLVLMKSIFHRAHSIHCEDYFGVRFTQLVNHSLKLKKGEPTADRIAKFVAHFVRILGEEVEKSETCETSQRNEKEETREKDGDERFKTDRSASGDASMNEDALRVTQFTAHLIKHLIRGIDAANKSVRYRVTQLLALITKYMGDIDKETFELLCVSLMSRLKDKEVPVRMQAVLALSNFQSYTLDLDSGFTNDSEVKDNIWLTSRLVRSLMYDDSAEVRRAAMLNLHKSVDTIPHLWERVKDVNAINRRIVYSKITPELGGMQNMRFEHRQYLLTWGLNDRDERVSRAAINLLCYTWLDSCEGNVLEFLDYLNVTESSIAEKAIGVLFSERPEIVQKLKFDENFWKALDVNKSFLWRMFFKHCEQNKLYDLLDTNFPDALEMSNILKKYLEVKQKIRSAYAHMLLKEENLQSDLNSLENEQFLVESEHMNSTRNLESVLRRIASAKEAQKRERSGRERKKIRKQIEGLQESQKKLEARLEQLPALLIKLEESRHRKIQEFHGEPDYEVFSETQRDFNFLVNQLLLICVDFDLSDEIGRRAMLNVVRGSLNEKSLDDAMIINCLKILKKISVSERDFVGMTVEIITDIRDSGDDVAAEYFENELQSHAATQNDSEVDADSDSDDDNQSQGQSQNQNQSQSQSQGQSKSKSKSKSKRRKIQPSIPNDETLLRCLNMTKHVLQLVDGKLEHYLSLNSLYTGVVNHCLNHPETPLLYMAGLECLGLYALLDENIAKDALMTFFRAIKVCGVQLQMVSAIGLFDIFSVYGIDIVEPESRLPFIRLFYKLLRSESSEVQATVAEGIIKLFLADIFEIKINLTREEDGIVGQGHEEGEGEEEDENNPVKEIFVSLLLAYFSSSSSSNHAMRQILAFCIPVYCFSHPNHQLGFAYLGSDLLLQAIQLKEHLHLGTVLPQLIAWSDPRNLIQLSEEEKEKQPNQLVLATRLLEIFVVEELTKEDRRAIVNNVSKVSVSAQVDLHFISNLLDEVEKVIDLVGTGQLEEAFQLDRFTLKNLSSLKETVESQLEKAKEREEREKLKQTRSRSVSFAPEGEADESLQVVRGDIKVKTEPGEVLASEVPPSDMENPSRAEESGFPFKGGTEGELLVNQAERRPKGRVYPDASNETDAEKLLDPGKEEVEKKVEDADADEAELTEGIEGEVEELKTMVESATLAPPSGRQTKEADLREEEKTGMDVGSDEPSSSPKPDSGPDSSSDSDSDSDSNSDSEVIFN